MRDRIAECLKASAEVKLRMISERMEEIEAVCRQAIQVVQGGGTIFLFGNGGSAADAQHIAAELVGRFACERDGLPALALTTDTSVLTSVGNDYGFEEVLSRQVGALVRTGDMLIGISTSGSSPNVVKGLKVANEKGAVTVALTGDAEGPLSRIADFCIRVPSRDTPRIQEAHIVLGHILCEAIEESLETDRDGELTDSYAGDVLRREEQEELWPVAVSR